MAYQNKTIRNPKTGLDIHFLQVSKDTSGKLLEMESTYNAKSTEPVPHFPPHQEEDFQVISGQLSVRIDGEVKVLKPGEGLHIAKYKVHPMWNDSDQPTVVNWKVQPAMDTEHLLEMAAGLANCGKTDAMGKPDFLQSVLLAKKYSSVFRVARPAYFIQKILFGILAPIAVARGYISTCKKYLD